MFVQEMENSEKKKNSDQPSNETLNKYLFPYQCFISQI